MMIRWSSNFLFDNVGILKEISLFFIKRVIEIKNYVAKLPSNSFNALCFCYKFIPKELLVAEHIHFAQRYEDITWNINLPKKIRVNGNGSSDSLDNSSNSEMNY